MWYFVIRRSGILYFTVGTPGHFVVYTVEFTESGVKIHTHTDTHMLLTSPSLQGFFRGCLLNRIVSLFTCDSAKERPQVPTHPPDLRVDCTVKVMHVPGHTKSPQHLSRRIWI